MTLIEFLLARIAEDEAAAQVRTVSHRMISGKMVDIPMYHSVGAWAWSPDRVLAECEAKRRIVEACQVDLEGLAADLGLKPEEVSTLSGLVLRALTLPYAAHPDYDETWRP